MKLAVITGASSGIGAATARLLGKHGYRVVLVARNRAALDEVAAGIGSQAAVEACDASEGDAVVAMAERVRRDHGVPDVIVNSAGAGAWHWIEDTPPAEALAMMRAPYFAAFNLSHAFMSEMLERDSGVLIHVNSPVSFATWPGCTGYAAARWALRVCTRRSATISGRRMYTAAMWFSAEWPAPTSIATPEPSRRCRESPRPSARSHRRSVPG